MDTIAFKKIIRIEFIKQSAFSLSAQKREDIKREDSSLTKLEAEQIASEFKLIKKLFKNVVTSRNNSAAQEAALRELLFSNYIKQHVLLNEEKSMIESLRKGFDLNSKMLESSIKKIKTAYDTIRTI
jgi:hypothetical protein